ncbi:transposase [Pandoraea iniqua]|uniref:Transposase n=1 Tax=Pandoraea iniqua TaxID=2508288 RepID=A0A5E4YE76_9BURK|nr:transposase [Pandoraea iniqua]
MTEQRREFSPEFKRNAAALVRDQSDSRVDAFRSVGVAESVLDRCDAPPVFGIGRDVAAAIYSLICTAKLNGVDEPTPRGSLPSNWLSWLTADDVKATLFRTKSLCRVSRTDSF